jgi:hypothetical protein
MKTGPKVRLYVSPGRSPGEREQTKCKSPNGAVLNRRCAGASIRGESPYPHCILDQGSKSLAHGSRIVRSVVQIHGDDSSPRSRFSRHHHQRIRGSHPCVMPTESKVLDREGGSRGKNRNQQMAQEAVALDKQFHMAVRLRSVFRERIEVTRCQGLYCQSSRTPPANVLSGRVSEVV